MKEKFILMLDDVFCIKHILKHLNDKSLRYLKEKNLTKHHLKRIIIFNISIKQHIKQLFYSNTELKTLINNIKKRLLINNLQIKPP